MANFFSMGVYYNDGNNVMGDPRDSLFWRLVLYPELAGAPQLDELIEKIKSATGLTQIGKHTQTLLRQFLTQKGHKAASELDSIISSVPKGANEAVVAQALKKGLEAALEEASPDIESILEEGYLSDVQKRRGNYTYKTVQKEWENDIEALRIALKRGFIPAVNLEKAFGARETRRLENIRDRLPGDKFRDFIANNLEIIEAAKVGELKAAESQRMADRAVREEIGGILSTIDRPGAI